MSPGNPASYGAYVTTPSLEHWLATSLRTRADLPPSGFKTLALLTVVIPCYGRQDFLLRQCAYWQGSGARVVIVDGSPEPLGEGIQKIVSALEDITYLYANASMMDRLQLASRQIQTPYAILLGDDEFLLFTGLCSAINLLEQNPALVACIAQSLAFYPSPDGTGCTYGTGYPHWKYSVQQDDVRERLNVSMSDYTAATCYAVLRTPVWRKSWGQLQNWSSPYVGEMQQGLTTYIWGKLATVDEVYWMRSNENRPVTSKDFNRGLSFQEWWASPKFKLEQGKFVALLTDELVQAACMEPYGAEATIREAITSYIAHLNEVTRKMAETLTGREATIRKLRAAAVDGVKRLLPQQLIGGLKSMLFSLASVAGEGSLGSLADLRRINAFTPFLISNELTVELSEMEALIASFYGARKSQTT